MPRIHRLVLFRMVNENFSVFSFHTLALPAKKKGKPIEGRAPCGTLRSLVFIPLTYMGCSISIQMQEECQGAHSTDVIAAKIQPVLVCTWKMWEHKRKFRGHIKTEKTNLLKRGSGDVPSLLQNRLREDVNIVYMETELIIPGDMQFCWHWTNKIQKLALKFSKLNLETLKQNLFY